MKKVLINLLLLANLSTSLGFALDYHPEAMLGHDAAADTIVADLGENDRLPVDEGHVNHHCCHGAAHMVGIFSSETTPLAVVDTGAFITLLQNFYSLTLAPHLRPPIV